MGKAKSAIRHLATPPPIGQRVPLPKGRPPLCGGGNYPDRPLEDSTYNYDLCNCHYCKVKVRQKPQLFNALAAARQPELPLGV